MVKHRLHCAALLTGALTLLLAGAGCQTLQWPWSDTAAMNIPTLKNGDGVVPMTQTEEESEPERVSVLTQQLAAQQDERKALAGRLQYAEGQLEEKENALLLAGTEMTAATEELTKSRKETQRCKQEAAELRERLRKLEKENKDALSAAVRLLEQMLEKLPPPTERRPAELESSKQP